MKRATGVRQPYTVSLFGQIALAGAVLVYLFSATWDPTQISHFFTMTLLLLAGVILSVVMVGVRFIPFDTKHLVADLISTAVSFGSVWLINAVVSNISLSSTDIVPGTSPIGTISFGILAGVAEGWFFHLWLVGWINDITGTPFIAVPATSLVWSIFHLARYGADMNQIILIFIAGIPLAALTLYFRSNDGPTFGHMLVNALVGRA